MCEYVVNCSKVDFNEIKFKEIFLKYECDTHENIECINELVSDIAFSLEQNEGVSRILAKEYPQLSSEQIKAVQRMITIILLAFECNEQTDHF